MNPSTKKVRFSFERLELRDTPAQLGGIVTLPQMPPEGLDSDGALTASVDPSSGGGADVKLDPTSLVRVKLDPAGVSVKLDPVSFVSVKI